MFFKVQALRFEEQHIHVPFNLITVFLLLFNDESIIFYLEEVMSFLIIHPQIRIGLTSTKLSVLCIKYHEDRKQQGLRYDLLFACCFSTLRKQEAFQLFNIICLSLTLSTSTPNLL